MSHFLHAPEDALPRLGVNIDHIATLRQLRGTPYPSLVEAARICEQAGAHQITVHLREDRRHIQDSDVKELRAMLKVALNLEMAATEGMARFAARVRPDWVCLVPERRQELTTEGGLELSRNKRRIGGVIERLKKAGIRVSTFIEPGSDAVKTSQELGVDAVEFHTGRFCLAAQSGPRGVARARAELDRLRKAALLARKLGLQPHAGHGFDYENVRRVVALEDDQSRSLIDEYNIGHSIVCRAALVGLGQAVREMISSILAP